MKYVDTIRSFLTIDKQKPSWKIVLVLMIISYIFSIAIRYIWVLQVENTPSYQWNNEIMINTNDGYYYAQGAKDILNNTKLYLASPTDIMLSKLTAFLSKILPFSFESIILYMPAFFGSLLIVPVILISRALKITYVGFGASLIAGIAWSYYNRTMVGYYDTDMLNIVLPTLLTSLIIYALSRKNIFIFPIITAVMLFYASWYATNFFYSPLLVAILFYVLVFEKKELLNYQLLSIYMISMSNLDPIIIMASSISLTALFYWIKDNLKEDLQIKIIYSIFSISVILALMNFGFTALYSRLEDYVFRKAISEDLSLVFFNVVGTVREAGKIPFEVFANRISGGTFLLFTSTIGVLLLVFRYPVMLISLPLVAIGFIALKGGLRFTVYAVPINALGMSFVIFLFSFHIRKFLSSMLPIIGQKMVYISVISSLLFINLYYHIEHVKGYKVPTVFSKKETSLLDTLSKKISKDDYILSWWDYGYPIRYYAQAQTLIDGGKHSGVDNFPISFALSKPMTPSANMLRLNVEYEVMNSKEPRAGNIMAQMMNDYKYTKTRDFLLALDSKSFNIPSPTRDIYLYLPFRMLNIFPTVMLFSNLDIQTGRQFPQPLFFNSPIISHNANEVLLSQNVKIFRKNGNITGKIQIGSKVYDMKYYIRTFYDKNKVLHKEGVLVNKNSGINVIYMQDYNRFLITDNISFHSTFVQLFILEDFDKTLYEPVALDPQVKIYRLKI